VFKWWWEPTPPKAYSMLLTQSQLEALTASAEIKLTKVEQKTQGKPAATPGPNDNPQDPKFQPVEATFDVDLRLHAEGRPRARRGSCPARSSSSTARRVTATTASSWRTAP
jgi:hypothetical protein